MMKSKVLVSVLLSSGLLLTGCNVGSGSNKTATNHSTQSYGTRSTIMTDNESLPQVNVADVKLIFNALADSSGKIDTQEAVDIVLGNHMDKYNLIMSLATTGYPDALNKQQALLSTFPDFNNSLLSQGSREQYNLALFAAIFITDTSSTNSSDGVDAVGDITLDKTLNNLDMVSHRFFGGNRMPSQDYTWSVQNGTFMAVLNNKHSNLDVNDISYNNIHQGAVGDCYFLSTLGALINQRGASYVANLIHNDNGNYSFDYTTVHSQESSIAVGNVNDLAVAVGAYSGAHGNWLNVIEQAFGNVLMSNEYSFIYFGNKAPTDGIYSLPTFFAGMISAKLPIGQYYTAFKFLTGHEVYEFSADYNDAGDTSFKNVYASNQEGYVNFAPNQLTTKQLISVVDRALNDGRVIVFGTTADANALEPSDDASHAKKLPPDVVGNHAYAVLAHKNGKFTVRNPWGTNYTPTGAEGLQNGYKMVNGVFEVPDSEVFSIFTQVDIEQLPGLDSTPQVVNGNVVLNSKGKPIFTTGSSNLFAGFLTSNQSYIKNNFTDSVNTQPNFFDPSAH